jgi:hypothetical protein
MQLHKPCLLFFGKVTTPTLSKNKSVVLDAKILFIGMPIRPDDLRLRETHFPQQVVVSTVDAFHYHCQFIPCGVSELFPKPRQLGVQGFHSIGGGVPSALGFTHKDAPSVRRNCARLEKPCAHNHRSRSR